MLASNPQKEHAEQPFADELEIGWDASAATRRRPHSRKASTGANGSG